MHKREKITRDRVTAKLKKIQTAYRKAEDSQRKSGGGRVGMTFYSVCSEIWGGKPEIKSSCVGFEHSSVNDRIHKGSSNGADDDDDDDDDEVQEDPFIDSCIRLLIAVFVKVFQTADFLQQILVNMELMIMKDTEDDINKVERGDNTVKSRRERIDKTLKECKDKRLARKRGRGTIHFGSCDIYLVSKASVNHCQGMNWIKRYPSKQISHDLKWVVVKIKQSLRYFVCSIILQ